MYRSTKCSTKSLEWNIISAISSKVSTVNCLRFSTEVWLLDYSYVLNKTIKPNFKLGVNILTVCILSFLKANFFSSWSTFLFDFPELHTYTHLATTTILRPPHYNR